MCAAGNFRFPPVRVEYEATISNLATRVLMKSFLGPAVKENGRRDRRSQSVSANLKKRESSWPLPTYKRDGEFFFSPLPWGAWVGVEENLRTLSPMTLVPPPTSKWASGMRRCWAGMSSAKDEGRVNVPKFNDRRCPWGREWSSDQHALFRGPASPNIGSTSAFARPFAPNR